MPKISLDHITKTFGSVKALDNVSLEFAPGEIHAVVGENGAGKSTIMKILGGLYGADSGTITIDGKVHTFGSVADAQAAGITIVYQELNLMPDLTVAENIFLRKLPGTLGIVNKKELNRQTQELLDSLHVSIQAEVLAGSLSVSEQQLVAIANALALNSDTIIMDEPTAALNTQEVDTLYGIIKALKARGKTIIYISHRLKEIFDLSDRISILRDGRFIRTTATKDISHDDLVALMVGRSVMLHKTKQAAKLGEALLEVKNLTCKGHFEDISFTLHEGEILGFAGLMGCGKEDIAKALYGLLPIDQGIVLLDGDTIFNYDDDINKIQTPANAIKQGIGFVTDDRKNAGIFAQMSVRDNLTMSVLKLLSHLGIISDKASRKLLFRFTRRMSIKYASPTQPISSLSGGNQQKFILSRVLAADCSVLILLEPTRGIDIGAKNEIYALLAELAQKGMAIMLVSSELTELLSYSTRIAVIFQGRMTGMLTQDTFDPELVMQCATGNKTFGLNESSDSEDDFTTEGN